MTRKEFESLVKKLNPCQTGMARLRHAKGTVLQVLKEYAACEAHPRWLLTDRQRLLDQDFAWLELNVRSLSLPMYSDGVSRPAHRAAKRLIVELKRVKIF